MEFVLITNGQWFHQVWLHHEVTITAKRGRSQMGFGKLNMRWHSGRKHGNIVPLPHTLLCKSLLADHLPVHFLVNKHLCVKCFSCPVSSCSGKLIKPEEGTMGTLIYS